MSYSVPELPYGYDALEPHIDEQTMQVHHDKHHQAYVDKANAALEGTEWADADVDDVLRRLDQLSDDIRTAVRNNAGQVARFHNATVGGGFYGGTSHNVTAKGSFGGRRLFKSPTISSGSTTSVNGTQYLAPGDYVFHCTIHGPSMSATLRVVGGAPLARPKVELTVASAKVAGVRKSGKLAVKVSGSGSKASGVALSATRSGRTIAHKRGVSVGAGASKAVKLALSKRGRKALRGLDRATIKVTARVPFGRPAAAKRTLH